MCEEFERGKNDNNAIEVTHIIWPTIYKFSLSIVIGMQAEVDDSVSKTSISSIDRLFSATSLVTKSTDASDTSSLDEPTSDPPSTPLSPEVDPTSIDAALPPGESFSKEKVDKGDEVIELKAFVMNIFGVERPVSQLLLVDESGLGQIGKGDMIGDDPRLKLLRKFNVIIND